MSNRDNLIKTYPIISGTDSKVVEVEVSYSLGGYSMFTSAKNPRGYSLHAQPLTRSNGWVNYSPMEGVKLHLEDANRFSAKKLESIVPSDEDIEKLLVYIEINSNIVISREEI